MTATVLRADARCLPLPDASVDLVVTSPPYFGLRSYTDGGVHYAGQLGSEATPAAYVDALVACTAEWVRVLKPSGSIFVNLGDKYDSGTTTARINPGTVKDGQGQGWYLGSPRVSLGQPKSLIGLPWRYAIACMDQLGLILRAEIVWAKPNGLPESVTDRVRRAHEQVFHFTVRPRYYSAVDEIREPHTGNAHPAGARAAVTKWESGNGAAHRTGRTDLDQFNPLGKLPGSVWTIPSQPLTVPPHLGADHFAAFPMELPRRLILGWSPPGVCCECGEGRRPVTDKRLIAEDCGAIGTRGEKRLAQDDPGVRVRPLAVYGSTSATITGYACACPQPTAPTRPAAVLDPFGGTGTTALLAHVSGRHGITADMSADYCRIAAWRTTDPGERARAMLVPKPPPVADGQETLFALP
jgi:DNA modification methylase